MSILFGRLGLEKAGVPHADRHGLVWLNRGRLYVSEGTVRFATKGFGALEAGDYSVPYQNVSNFLIGPGCTITHDVLRIFARHGTGLIAVGENGVRFYASMPSGADTSRLARRQVALWADSGHGRNLVVRRMYAWRLGEVLPDAEISVLRGIEGSRMKRVYQNLAQQYGINWHGRRYDRQNPHSNDPPNNAINHASTAVESAAMIAVAATSTIPQLGFIHEDSANAFCLDISDIYRDSITIPVAFAAVKEFRKKPHEDLERLVRKKAGTIMRKKKIIPDMITKIKELLDPSSDPSPDQNTNSNSDDNDQSNPKANK
jgi:CRISP-associated protein Cas1